MLHLSYNNLGPDSARAVGAVYKLNAVQLAHSLKAPGSNPWNTIKLKKLVSTLGTYKVKELVSKFAFTWVNLYPLQRACRADEGESRAAGRAASTGGAVHVEAGRDP